MHQVLAHIAKKKKFDLPPEVAQEIIDDSGGNLRKAILVFEALKMQSFVLSVRICQCTTKPSIHPQTRLFWLLDDCKTGLGNLLP
jgi:DNA polymerase III delta prime subunit